MSKGISIDSFKIRIPIEDVQIINPEITSTKSLVNNLTGEVEREFKERSYKVERDGIKIRFALEIQVQPKRAEYLVILINAKILQERYFEGICQATLETLYLRLMAEKVVDFSMETFLRGQCTDVDIKKDFINEDLNKSIKIMIQNAKEHKQVNKGYNSFNQKTNKGIEFGKRKTATGFYPYLKIYHKGLELRHKSNLFMDRHLQGKTSGIDNLVRMETTIKGKKAFRRHGIEDTSLGNIANLSQVDLQGIFNHALGIHLNKLNVRDTKPREGLTPTDQIILNSINDYMDGGLSIGIIKSRLTSNLSKETRALERGLKKIEGLYTNYIKGNNQDVQNKAQEDFFKEMGWLT